MRDPAAQAGVRRPTTRARGGLTECLDARPLLVHRGRRPLPAAAFPSHGPSRRAGHTVAFATAASYAERVQAAGFDALPAGVGADVLQEAVLEGRARMRDVPPAERRPARPLALRDTRGAPASTASWRAHRVRFRHSSSSVSSPRLRAASTQSVCAWRRFDRSPSGVTSTCSLVACSMPSQNGQT